MKTMLTLIAMLLVGNAVAGNVDYDAIDAHLRDPKNIGSLSSSERARVRPAVPGGIEMAEKAAKAQTPYVPTSERTASDDSPASVLLHPVNPGVLAGGGYTVRDMGPLGVSISKQP
jgi:hypothetical protein